VDDERLVLSSLSKAREALKRRDFITLLARADVAIKSLELSK
jgi:hypothetical protein